jgi:hypothetical protein
MARSKHTLQRGCIIFPGHPHGLIREPAPLDLPLESQSLLSYFALPEDPLEGRDLPNILTGERQDSGAVRQAVDLASKRQGLSFPESAPPLGEYFNANRFFITIQAFPARTSAS